MKLKLKRGTTSKIARFFVQDTSQSDGRGLTGLVYNSGSLTAYYICEGQSSATQITLASATVGTFTSGGFAEIDSTNLPGIYELGVPNAVLATGGSAVIMLKGATNMAPVLMEFELDAVDYQDSTDFGLSAVPIDLATAVPTSNTAHTVGDCLNAARAQGFGKWTLSGTTLTLFASDGSTAVRTFTLDSATAPTSRT